MADDIFVIVEQLEGKPAESTFGLLGKGKELAQGLGGGLTAVLLGSGVRGLADQLGVADLVLSVDHPQLAHYTPEAYKKVLGALVRERVPRLTMVANTAMGMDLAAGLSAEVHLPLVAYCRDLRLEGGRLIAVSQIYGGKVMAEAEVEGGQAIVSVLAGAFPADAGRVAEAGQVEDVALPVPLDTLRIRFRCLIQPEAGEVDITKEPILVSVGRGIQSKDNIPIVQELTEALGGALSASRPITDNNWLPRTRQVGKSGMTVKPKLYIAVGISGAPEHVEGMKDAGLIVAINTDPKAPIFDAAHYGVTADLFDVVPLLTERIRSLKG
ncbi:MAG: electron transfer flavoprotein subunit alpha/FixB family protein [Candidatus Methylomirabilia bacterium]